MVVANALFESAEQISDDVFQLGLVVKDLTQTYCGGRVPASDGFRP